MTRSHDAGSLGAYVLSALDQQEMRAMERHLASCARCSGEVAQLRLAQAGLGEIPPEVWLDGPPEDGDLLLHRTLRRIRRERQASTRNRRFVLAVAAAVAGVVLAAGGVTLGRMTATTDIAAPAAPRSGEGRTVSSTDTVTGASLRVNMQPASGWVRLTADVKGIPQGEKCRLYVISRHGSREEAGSWLVSESGAGQGTRLSGSALVAPEDVAGIEVENFDGKHYVGVNVS